MANTQILRQYLLSIGYSVDEKEGKKLEASTGRLDKAATRLAYTFASTGLAAAAMVTQFARQMEKLYYSSKKAESAAGNLQAIEYMGQQIGLSAGAMTESVTALARNLRANPGLVGLLNSLGVTVEGRDKADVMIDLVKSLKGMPFYVAQQFAQMFGIDPDQLLLLEQSVDELEKLRAERKAMAADVGVDSEAAAAAGKEYMNQWRQITEQVGLLRDALAIRLLPVMQDLAGVTKDLMKDWTRIVQTETPGSLGGKIVDGLRSLAGIRAGGNGSGVQLSAYGRSRANDPRLAGLDSDFKGRSLPSASMDVDPSLLGRLEAQYGLPPGLLDRIWNQESRRGKAMLSPAGARGHFGFMPGTQKEMGLDDPNDFVESANAAARYMDILLKRYGGDLQKATAAYNWGMGNVDRKGLSKAPWETQDYVAKVAGQPITIQQTNQFTFTGSMSPEATKAATFESLSTANRDLVRNVSGSVE